MAKEQTIEQVTEQLRREAVAAIAAGGRQAEGTVRNTSQGMANAGRAVLGDMNQDAAGYDVPGLAAELEALVAPALQASRAWGTESAAFERSDAAGRARSTDNFFSGVRTATPIVQSQADASRAAAEADLLNSILQQEVSVGQQNFTLSEALENRRRAREQFEAARQAEQRAIQMDELQRQATLSGMARADQSFALEQEMNALQRQALEQDMAAAQRAMAPAPAPSRSFGEAMAQRSSWGWR